MKTKVCLDCKRRRLIKFFYATKKVYLCSYCKTCEKIRHQVSFERNKPARVKAKKLYNKANPNQLRISRLRAAAKELGHAAPSFTVKELTAFKAKHNGQCEIKECTRAGACTDHCHKTGKFRGWLCSQHNLALGHCQDSIAQLKALIKYLQRKLP